MKRVKSDTYSNHGLPIGAIVTLVPSPEWGQDSDWYTQGGVDDEVAIDPRDLDEVAP